MVRAVGHPLGRRTDPPALAGRAPSGSAPERSAPMSPQTGPRTLPAAHGGRHTGGDALRRARLPVFTVERLGVVMAPEPGNPLEVEGVLNPAGAAGPDGHHYLFPRLVPSGHHSRIGVARA